MSDNKFEAAEEEGFPLCGSGVGSYCVDATITMDDVGWQRFSNDITDVALLLIKSAIMGGSSEFTFKMIRGFNSLRCAVSNFSNNFWNLIGALWYFASEFGFEEEIKKLFDEYYPWLCTCQKESEIIAFFLEVSATVLITMSSCNEQGQIADAKAYAEEEEKKKQEAEQSSK